jgi:hypothetical protein
MGYKIAINHVYGHTLKGGYDDYPPTPTLEIGVDVYGTKDTGHFSERLFGRIEIRADENPTPSIDTWQLNRFRDLILWATHAQKVPSPVTNLQGFLALLGEVGISEDGKYRYIGIPLEAGYAEEVLRKLADFLSATQEFEAKVRARRERIDEETAAQIGD